MPTTERLRELLAYDAETGTFRWRVRRSSNANAGSIAGTVSHGYIAITIDGVTFHAHRLAWLYVHGEYPSQPIDHVNGRRDDNRIANLRLASSSINNQNRRTAHAASGLLGAYPFKGRWKSSICVDRKQIHLGVFDTADAAHSAYVTAKRQLHPGCTI